VSRVRRPRSKPRKEGRERSDRRGRDGSSLFFGLRDTRDAENFEVLSYQSRFRTPLFHPTFMRHHCWGVCGRISKTSQKRFFLGMRPLCDPSGRADAADCCRGAPVARKQSTGPGVPAHTPGPARSDRVLPPTETE
jgi:hypothetical protein